MDGDGEELNPLVPHNSMIDCRSGSSKNEYYQIKVNETHQKLEKNTSSFRSPVVDDKGRQVIDVLKSRLYDKPENSDVFKAISRPLPTKITPHPPSGDSPKLTMGSYRTTMFRRDFNRLQAKRAQASSQAREQIGHQTVIPPIKRNKSESPVEQQEEVDEDSACLEQQEVSNGNHNITEEKAPPSPVSSISTKDDVSGKPSSRTVSKSDKLDSLSSSLQPKDQNYNVLELPESQGLPENDSYLGLDGIDVIRRLRIRLNRSPDLEAIANGIDIDGDENNLIRLYIKDDDGKFLYCLSKNRNVRAARYNPYDLECVTPAEAKSWSQSFTISSSAITQLFNGVRVEITPTERWLYERRIFKGIKDKPVFAKFRMWKGFICWKKNVRFLKNNDSKHGIESILFANIDIYQAAILKVRGLCEDACSSLTGIGKGEDAIALLSVQPENNHTLEGFCINQEEQVKEAKEKISKLRRTVVEIVKRACESVAEREGLTDWIYPERTKQDNKQSDTFNKKITDLKDMQREKDKANQRNPSFTQMSLWRGVLKRVACFIRLIDFLLLELFRRLVLVGVRTLVAQAFSSSTYGKTVTLSLMETTEEEQKRLSLKKVDSFVDNLSEQHSIAEALLRVSLVLCVPDPYSKSESVDGPKKVTFQDDSDKEDDQDNASTTDGASSVSTLRSAGSSVIIYPKSFIRMSPSYEEFHARLLGVINLFERTVGGFPSLTREKELTVFTTPPSSDVVFALSRDIEEEAKTSKVPWPDTELLFGADVDYQEQVRNMVELLRRESENVMSYAQKFMRFCSMVDRARRVDVDASLKQSEWSTEKFNAVLNQHTEQVHSMKEMMLVKRIGLFHIETDGFQQATIPYPSCVIDALSKHLPRIAAKRNDALLKVIKNASNKLDKPSETVEDFVDHLIFLSRMSSEINALEREYTIVTRLYSIAKNFDMKIEAEEFALSQTLMPSFMHLKSTILFCLAKRDENIQFYSKALDELISAVRRNLRNISMKVGSPALLEADNIPQVITEKIKYLVEELEVIATKARNYTAYFERFGTSMSTTYQKKALAEGKSVAVSTTSTSLSLQSEVSEVEKDLSLRKLLWQSLQEWEVLVDKWKATIFENLSTESMQNDVSRFFDTVFVLEKGLPPNKVVPRLKEKVTIFKFGMPVITSLRNPALRTRHWEAIQEVIGTRFVRDRYFTLGHLLRLEVFKYKEKILEISSQATSEATLEQMLQKIMDFWYITEFKLVAHPTRDVAVISQADDVIASLEESQVTLSNIRNSKHVTPIKSLVEDWDRKLALFARTLDEWLVCQRNWLYLESIFAAADIQRQLPNEARLFSQVDKSWRDIMRRTADKPNAFKASIAAGVLEVLQSSNSHLNKIHKCLEDYLETKRLVFSRFYFLSNEDLLDILANSKNANSIQPHLRKCFQNIHFLEIVRQAHSPPQIKYMMSVEGECVNLPKTLRARGNVESWLLSVENAMYETIKLHIKNAISSIGTMEYTQWVLKHPGQTILTASQIFFSREVVRCLQSPRAKDSLVSLRNKMISTLTVLSQLVTSPMAEHKHAIVESLLTIEVHGRDVLDVLIENNVTQPEDFEWSRHLRYDWEDDRNACTIRHCDALFEYGYEYIGCAPRLVMTPLTDRCYLTLTGALNLHLHGAPSGPAGTGKTETVKDLAKALGKHCLVFNCSEGLDYKMMGKMFSGIAQSGSWICFDEFNRIDVEVLSVIAQQLLSIKSAKDNQTTRFLFEGRDIKLNPTCAVFITMNPTYAGRVELPDNLKALFRPVAMMVPDFATIAEIILFSEGFVAAAMLSRKMLNLYQLASKQLSQQDHYDFGLRAIKSVLIMAGQERRFSDLTNDSEDVEIKESNIVINAIKKSNIPKFIASDLPLFNSILDDLFPGMSPPIPENRNLRRAISIALGETHYEFCPSQIDKIIQFHHTLLVRHGIMLIGPAGGGKTTARKILQRALVFLPSIEHRQKHEKHVEEYEDKTSNKTGVTHMLSKAHKGKVEVSHINAKCLTLGELYGEFNATTMEWSDGLLSCAYRRFAQESRPFASKKKKKQKESQPSSRSTTPASTIRPLSARSATTISGVTVDEQTFEGETTYAEEVQSTIQEDVLAKEEVRNWYWIVMDGPVDTQWVENVNTVLDDSKVLCLANGERVSMGLGMRIVFEVDNLSNASPATVSRCGMIYMEPDELGWVPYVNTWLKEIKEKYKVPDLACNHLLSLFSHTIDPGVRFMRDHSENLNLHPPALSLVSTVCGIVGGFIDIIEHHGGFILPHQKLVTSQPENDEKMVTFADDFERELKTRRISCVKQNPKQLLAFLSKVFVFAFTWAFGGVLDSYGADGDDEFDDQRFSKPGLYRDDENGVTIRQVFDQFVRDLFTSTGEMGVVLPGGNDTMFSYYIDIETGNFVKWDILVPPIRALIAKSITDHFVPTDSTDKQVVTDCDIDRSLVPTLDTIRYSFLIAIMAVNKQPVLLTGGMGVGKTALILDILARLSHRGGTSTNAGTILGAVFRSGGKNLVESILEASLGVDNASLGYEDEDDTSEPLSFEKILFSAHTTASKVRSFIESKLIKRGREALGPKQGQKMVIFMDDFNMPQPDAYNSHPPLELVRELVDSGGFYDTKKLLWKEVHDVTLLAACSPPGGGRSPLNDRLLRHFSVLNLPYPTTKWLKHIYGTHLGRYFEKGEFTDDIRESRNNIVHTVMGLYHKMTSGLLPTPAKSHYTFNMRDISKVIEGMLQAHPTVITTTEHCINLLIHECSRVFHDRLIDENDRRFFYSALSDALHTGFHINWKAEVLQNLSIMFGDFIDSNMSAKGAKIYHMMQHQRVVKALEDSFGRSRHSWGATQHRLVFFGMAVRHITRAARVFRNPGQHMMMVGVGGTGKCTVARLAAFIEECNFMKPAASRVYLRAEFCEDIKKAYLSAGLHGEKTVLFLNDNVAKDAFLEDISCILSSGEVHNVFENDDMENIVLTLSREVSKLGMHDSKKAIYHYFLQRAKKNLHLVISTSPIGQHFRHNCRSYPSLINCCTIDWYDTWSIDALGSVAASFLETTDLDVSQVEDTIAIRNSLAKVFVEIHCSVEKTSKAFYEEMHRRYYTTPTSYMEYIRLFSSKFQEKASNLSLNRERLSSGLEKLGECNTLVGTMQKELVDLGPQLERTSKDTEKLLEQFAHDQEAVDKVHNVVRQEEEFMNQEAMRVQAIADEAQRDLESVIPQLQEAIASLDALDKSDISEIRVYTKPPPMVMTVLSAVCVLLQQKPDWNTAKLLLADPGFLKSLVTYEVHSAPDKVFVRLKRYTQNPNFNPEAIGKISVACKSMCEWVLALENYKEVYKMVQPKQKRCDEAQSALQIANENLVKKQESLAKIQTQLNILQEQYDGSVRQLEELKNKKELTIARLKRASILTAVLSEEQDRWTKSLEQVGKCAIGLIGDTVLSTAAVTYFGAFTSTYRQNLMNRWLGFCDDAKVPYSKDFELTGFLSESVEVQMWLNNDLPHGQTSIENACIIKHCHRWPLIIDPQEQASKWIMNNGKENALKVVKATDTYYIKALEEAIPLGIPVLIEDVGEQLDASLEPLLTKNFMMRGNTLAVCFGDKTIEYNEHFKLYMTTALSNPHYLPDVCIKVTLINFTVTLEGLEDQLLSRTVQLERPQLEEKRKEILHNLVKDRFKLEELENRSLSLLHTSRGNILDDEVLITTLDESVKMSHLLQSRVEQSQHTQETINMNREKYSPVANRGAILYFVLVEMANVDVMYQFSLSWFTSLFAKCLESSREEKPHSPVPPGSAGTVRPLKKGKVYEKRMSLVQRAGFKRQSTVGRRQEDKDLPEYLKGLVDQLTEDVYRVVSHAIFARHKLTFSFMLCTSILRNDHLKRDPETNRPAIDEFEWDLFLRGAAVAAIAERLAVHEEGSSLAKLKASRVDNYSHLVTKMNKSPAKWIPESAWKECLQLSGQLDAFAGLTSNIAVNQKFWKKFSNCADPFKLLETGEDFDQPDATGHITRLGWHCTSLSTFQRLMLIKVLRPECLLENVRRFVENELGTVFVTSLGFDLQDIYEESSSTTPLIFILSSGTDPASHLMRFAKELRGTTLHLEMISLGRGQGPKAEEAITKAYHQKGKWVFLQNCHYASSFMPRLQHIVKTMSQPDSNVDPQFRMWLSSKPDPSFPISILQAGLKMTIEPPPGVKANLLRSFGGIGGEVSEAQFNDTSAGPAWKKLLFGLCLFNAVIHERKKFSSSLGWNVPYEFSSSDLEVAIQMLRRLLTDHLDVPWKAMWYLTGEIAYGGRVTDPWDHRCLQSILRKYYSPDVLQDDYGYTSDLVYRPPPPNISLSVCCTYIESLPATDSTELFGMDQNAHNTYLTAQAKILIQDLLLGQPTVAMISGSTKNKEEIVFELSNDITNRLPINIMAAIHHEPGEPRFRSTTPSQIKKMADYSRLREISNQSPILVTLDQEIQRYDALLDAIHSSLGQLRLALQGQIIMTDTLEDAFNSLLNNKVPALWKRAAYESCKPLGAWVNDLLRRTEFFSRWLDLINSLKDMKNIDPARVHPRAYWLSAFIFPQGFLTAVLQYHARMRNLPVDSMSFEYQARKECWTTDESVFSDGDIDFRKIAFQGLNPDDGVIVFGLYLDGASWDSITGVCESVIGQQRYPIPELQFIPYQNIEKDDKDRKDEEKAFEVYVCPVYRTSIRASSLTTTGHPTNFITSVELPSLKPASHWITRGVALLCQLDE